MVLKRVVSLFINTPPSIVKVGHPLLNARASEINPTQLDSPKVQKVIQEMTKAFQNKLSPVIGLSAPQLGHSVRLIAYQIQDKALIKERNLSKRVPLTFLVNPKIISKSGIKGELVEREWCESMPQYSGLVKRSEAIHVHALDLEGKLVDKKYSGLLARIIQHEMDHLEGINFTDIMEKKSLQHDSFHVL